MDIAQPERPNELQFAGAFCLPRVSIPMDALFYASENSPPGVTRLLYGKRQIEHSTPSKARHN
jgi:hypothetical protein